MKYMWLSIIVLCVVSVVAPVAQGSAVLKLTGDKVDFISGEDTSSFRLQDIKQRDTLRVWDVESFTIMSGGDTLVVNKTAEFVPIVLQGQNERYDLTIWFATNATRYETMTAKLRKYSSFGNTPALAGMQFRNADSNDSNLIQLREKYNLDSVAGSGSDIDRALNLMRWVHGNVRHDGSSRNPWPQNALHLLDVCIDSSRGVNCRMMAVILNEACLSVGLKSRHLTCLPEDKTDSDCHVVDMVWSDSLNKWVLIDPTFNGYFTTPDGVMMSPREVREAFIHGDSVVVSDELNYNGDAHSKDQYLAYMAKNLFRFEVPLESEFGYETRRGDVSEVVLNPIGYDTQKVATIDTSKTADSRYIVGYTDNADWFWEK